MTLNITVFSEEDLWQCSDHRMTTHGALETRIEDDFTNKYVDIMCLDGRMLITFAGLGKIGDLTMSRWLRSVLASNNGSVGAYAQIIAAKATADFGAFLLKHGIYHIFSVGAYIHGKPHLFLIANTLDPLAQDAALHLEPQFHIDHWDIRPPAFVAVGSGARGIDEEQRKRIEIVSRRKPRRTDDFHALLADVNLKVSGSPRTAKTVSPGCHTMFLTSETQAGEGRFHGPESMPPKAMFENMMMLQGLDFTDLLGPMWERTEGNEVKKPHPDPKIRRKIAKRHQNRRR